MVLFVVLTFFSFLHFLNSFFILTHWPPLASSRLQVPLAALTARAHELKDYMEKLEEQLSSSDILSQIPPRTMLLVPPVPLARPGKGDNANWPLFLG